MASEWFIPESQGTCVSSYSAGCFVVWHGYLVYSRSGMETCSVIIQFQCSPRWLCKGTSIEECVQHQKLRWVEHVLRIPCHRLAKRVLFSMPNSEWRKQRGGQPLTWQGNESGHIGQQPAKAYWGSPHLTSMYACKVLLQDWVASNPTAHAFRWTGWGCNYFSNRKGQGCFFQRPTPMGPTWPQFVSEEEFTLRWCDPYCSMDQRRGPYAQRTSHLVSSISFGGLVGDEIISRIVKATADFANLRHLWRRRDTSLSREELTPR
ncbi:hypothetical protein T265_05739 [Opisthorchis viverrini]|uniref:Uncharacterized protein n=1 Tax=Opisthorchis viverrini TaxID=6198 RepID=A0A074ZIR5_OPIVI|nr:hypothetical protein T265_05739 [Opisthorchis viverrini]KER27208.1 hypothetical protein T265_05739 [Opisthorchis viverrini]